MTVHHDFGQAQKMNIKNQKPVLIDFHPTSRICDAVYFRTRRLVCIIFRFQFVQHNVALVPHFVMDKGPARVAFGRSPASCATFHDYDLEPAQKPSLVQP